MKHYKHIILFLLCIVFSTTAFGDTKSSPYKPKWVTYKLPESSNSEKHYMFISAYGDGKTLDEARHKALANLAHRLETKRGVKVNSRTVPLLQRVTEADEFEMEVEDRGEKLDIMCRVIDEYWERDAHGYTIYVLYTALSDYEVEHLYDLEK